MLNRFGEWYSGQNDTVKAFIWIGLIAVIGIIFRWDYIMEKASSAFSFYSK